MHRAYRGRFFLHVQAPHPDRKALLLAHKASSSDRNASLSSASGCKLARNTFLLARKARSLRLARPMPSHRAFRSNRKASSLVRKPFCLARETFFLARKEKSPDVGAFRFAEVACTTLRKARRLARAPESLALGA